MHQTAVYCTVLQCHIYKNITITFSFLNKFLLYLCIAMQRNTVNFNSLQGNALHYTEEDFTTTCERIYTKVLLAAPCPLL